MGSKNDPLMDEDGEPLMVLDESSDHDWRRELSPTTVLADSNKVAKPRKRLVKSPSSAKETSSDRSSGSPDGTADWAPSSSKNRRKSPQGGGAKDRKSILMLRPELSSRKAASKHYRGASGDDEGQKEIIKQLWGTIAGTGRGDSEDDREGPRTMEDDAFIDDSGVDPAYGFGSDNEVRFARNAPQAEEGKENDESSRLKEGKKKKKQEKSPAELAMIIEHIMAELEVAVEEDAELNRRCKPAINKLKKLPLLIEVLSKKKLQHEFLDHGVLTLLKNWLEPLPDGSLPNNNIRTAILKILSELPIDLKQYDRREQLKRSGLGKVIMFLSKSDEETRSNRKLAHELVDKWIRPIFNKSTRYEDMRSFDDDRLPYRRPPSKKMKTKAAVLQSRDDDLDLAGFSQGQKSGQSVCRRLTSRPEALALDFVVRPQSKIDPEAIRARAKLVVHDQRRLKVYKKLQQLKATKKKSLQASKLSAEGRGMVKYL